MNCKDLKELLSAYVDDELSRTQREFVEEHLAVCADCKVTLEGYRAVNQKLISLREVPAMPDRKGAIMSKIKDMSNRPVRRWLRPALVAIPIVAILIALLVLQPWSPFLGPQGVMAKVYAATASLQSYRATTSNTNSEGKALNSEGEFVFPDRFHMEITSDGETDEFIIVGDKQYVKSGDLSRDVTITLAKSSSSILSREATLEILDSLTGLRTLPDERIEGVDCFHYMGSVDIERTIGKAKAKLDPTQPRYDEALKALEQMRTIKTEVELWIGKDDYLIRQMKQDTQAPDGIGGWSTSSTTWKYYDFNKPITIEPPLTTSGELLPGWQMVEKPISPQSDQPPYPSKTPPPSPPEK